MGNMMTATKKLLMMIKDKKKNIGQFSPESFK